MADSKFKAGQRWKRRDGVEVTIDEVFEQSFTKTVDLRYHYDGAQDSISLPYHPDGKTKLVGREDWDLVELVKVPEPFSGEATEGKR